MPSHGRKSDRDGITALLKEDDVSPRSLLALPFRSMRPAAYVMTFCLAFEALKTTGQFPQGPSLTPADKRVTVHVADQSIGH